jgi:hypothetical protein
MLMNSSFFVQRSEATIRLLTPREGSGFTAQRPCLLAFYRTKVQILTRLRLGSKCGM